MKSFKAPNGEVLSFNDDAIDVIKNILARDGFVEIEDEATVQTAKTRK